MTLFYHVRFFISIFLNTFFLPCSKIKSPLFLRAPSLLIRLTTHFFQVWMSWFCTLFLLHVIFYQICFFWEDLSPFTPMHKVKGPSSYCPSLPLDQWLISPHRKKPFGFLRLTRSTLQHLLSITFYLLAAFWCLLLSSQHVEMALSS